MHSYQISALITGRQLKVKTVFTQILHHFIDVFPGQTAFRRQFKVYDKLGLSKCFAQSCRQILKRLTLGQVKVCVLFALGAEHGAIHT